MNAGWLTMPFSDAVADESGGNEKTPQSEFLPEGRFAVVDQGKELIAGYVDDQSRLCHSELPVIVFGDHTRYFKYIDFPFCMGADGVKVLRPKIDASVKYLYYYLRQLRLTDGGYDRHFKYLKRCAVVVPPLAEQQRIADVLDRAEELRAKRRAALAQLDTLTQSIFLDLFGDPRENRSRCKMVPLGEVCVKLVDGTHQTPSYTARGVPFITVKNIATGTLTFEGTKFISEDEHARLTRHVQPERGDILVSKDGTIGVACPVETDREFSIFVSVALLKIKHDVVDQIFLTGQFRTDWIQSQIRAGTKGIAIRHLHLNDFKKLRVLLPAMSLQKEFVRRIAAVDKLRTVHRTWLGETDALFAVLQHRAFRGEL